MLLFLNLYNPMFQIQLGFKSVWDPGEDAMVGIDAVAMSSVRQGMVVSAENEDSTFFERTDLGTHANMVVPSRNCQVMSCSGKTVEVHPFSADHKALQVPIADAVVTQHAFQMKTYACLLGCTGHCHAFHLKIS